VGTAGAQRNRLPPNLPPDTRAITYPYGHLPGNVYKDGRIEFRLEQVVENDAPYQVGEKYRDLVDYWFLALANRDDPTHPPVQSCSEQIAPDDPTNTLHHRHQE
jgi:hypothetical protein